MHMYRNMYIYMYTYTDTCTHTCTYIYICTYVYTYMHINMHMHIHTCLHLYVHKILQMHVRTHIHAYTCVYVYKRKASHQYYFEVHWRCMILSTVAMLRIEGHNLGTFYSTSLLACFSLSILRVRPLLLCTFREEAALLYSSCNSHTASAVSYHLMSYDSSLKPAQGQLLNAGS